MKIKFEKSKFTFGGFYSCIYLIPTILIFWSKGATKMLYHRGFYIEFRFLNLNYSLIISVDRKFKINDIM